MSGMIDWDLAVSAATRLSGQGPEVALGEADGAQAGLAALAEVDPGVPRYTAAAAHLHERAGDRVRASELYAEAAALAPSVPERDHLVREAARVRSS